MKTYKVFAGGKSYTLAGLTDDVKQDIEDEAQAAERVRLHRQFTKKLIAADVYAAGQQSLQAMTFASEPVLKFISTPAGKKRLYRALLIHGGKCPEPTDADVDAVYDSHLDETSQAGATIKQIWEDAYPKAQTPPAATCPEGETPCEPSCSTAPMPT